MANKRIGTLTVGIFLVIIGILLLVRLITGTSLTRTLIDIWPVILISLGAEVLYYHYRSSQGDKLRYDLVSMLVLFLVGISAIGLYTLQASGLLDVVKKVPDYATYNINIAPEKIPVNGNIDRVILDNSSSNLRVRVVQSDTVEIHGSVNLLATSKDEARQLVKDNKGYNMRRQGKNLIIETHKTDLGKWFLHNGTQRNPLEILVPANLVLEINSLSGDIDLTADKVEKGWFIKENYGTLNVTLPAGLNADITAEAIQIVGNLDFVEQGKDTGDSENDTNTLNNSNSQENRTVHTQLGKAGARLHLINTGGTITVYQR